MAMPIQRFEDILWALESVSETGSLFCFFAFDDRPSHRIVLDFLTESQDWIDSLSGSSGMFTLFFSNKWESVNQPRGWRHFENMMGLTHEQSSFLGVLEKTTKYFNPTLKLAQQFGIKPRDLPGLILFEAFPDLSFIKPLYIPLDLAWFQASDQSRETILAEIYSCIQDVYQDRRALKEAELLAALGNALHSIHRPTDILKPLTINWKNALETLSEEVSVMPYSDKTIAPYLTKEEASQVNIFISYAHEDKNNAYFISERFREAGFKVWIDYENILPGQVWDIEIRKAIRECDFFVPLLSKESVSKRGYIQREFKLALHLWEEKLADDIYFLPIRLSGVTIPEEFAKFQWIDFDIEFGGWPKIMAAIKKGFRSTKS